MRTKQHNFPVAMRLGETPVPIPNTTVKTRAAESTIWATVWEDRWLPDLKRETHLCGDHRTEEILFVDDCMSSQKEMYLENRILKERF